MVRAPLWPGDDKMSTDLILSPTSDEGSKKDKNLADMVDKKSIIIIILIF